MPKKFPARIAGKPVGDKTLVELRKLPPEQLDSVEVDMGDGWVRPARFLSDGSDIVVLAKAGDADGEPE